MSMLDDRTVVGDSVASEPNSWEEVLAADFERAIVVHHELHVWCEADAWLYVHDPDRATEVTNFPYRP